MSKYYKYMKFLKDYLFESKYEYLDYGYAEKYFREHKYVPSVACSSVRVGNWYGRNLDWNYDNLATVVVRTKRHSNRYATLGVCGCFDELTNDFIKSGVQTDVYKVLPFYLLDGINENGVFANVNVVHIEDDYGVTTGTFPLVETRETISTQMLVRYVLDKFDSAESAVSYIRDYVSLYTPEFIVQQQDEFHFMIGDSKNTYILEVINNEVKIAEHNKMTNFYIYGVDFNDDGTVYTPYTQDDNHDAVVTNNVKYYGSGLERYNVIAKNEQYVDSKEDMRDLLDLLNYSHTYDLNTAGVGIWNTEFTGDYGEYGALKVNSSVNDFSTGELGEYIQELKEGFGNKERGDGKYWITCHSSVYDIYKQALYLVSQEEDGEYLFNFSDTSHSRMFDNYQEIPEGYIPDNRRRHIHIEKRDEFIIGGNCSFSFKFNGINEEDINDINFIYKSGVETYLVKHKEDLVITPSNCGGIIVTSNLQADETLNANTLRDMFIQVRFVMNSGDIVYSNKAQLDVIATLDPTYIPPNE